MRFLTHFLFSVLGFLLFISLSDFLHYSISSYFPLNSMLIVLFFLFLGTAFPDIDTASSKIGRKVPFFLKPIQFIFKHRGFFHSVFAGFLIAYLISLIAPIAYSLVFLMAYMLHILLDGFTVRGVKLFWPFPFRFKGQIRSGRIEESFLCLVFLALDIVLFFLLIGQ